MDLGGPVWHSSAAAVGRRPRRDELRALALAWLAGVGDRSQEWHEWSGYAYHVRRRLTPEEQLAVGDVMDLRGTLEGLARFEAVKDRINAGCVRLAHEELNPQTGATP